MSTSHEAAIFSRKMPGNFYHTITNCISTTSSNFSFFFNFQLEKILFRKGLPVRGNFSQELFVCQLYLMLSPVRPSKPPTLRTVKIDTQEISGNNFCFNLQPLHKTFRGRRELVRIIFWNHHQWMFVLIKNFEHRIFFSGDRSLYHRVQRVSNLFVCSKKRYKFVTRNLFTVDGNLRKIAFFVDHYIGDRLIANLFYKLNKISANY